MHKGKHSIFIKKNCSTYYPTKLFMESAFKSLGILSKHKTHKNLYGTKFIPMFDTKDLQYLSIEETGRIDYSSYWIKIILSVINHKSNNEILLCCLNTFQSVCNSQIKLNIVSMFLKEFFVTQISISRGCY